MAQSTQDRCRSMTNFFFVQIEKLRKNNSNADELDIGEQRKPQIFQSVVVIDIFKARRSYLLRYRTIDFIYMNIVSRMITFLVTFVSEQKKKKNQPQILIWNK